MCRPWWTPALRYGQHSHGEWCITVRDRTSEYLDRYERMVSQRSARSRSAATYLDHDHRKGEYVRFLATFPFVQYLWCSPSHGVTVLTRGALRGVQLLKDRGKAEIGDAHMPRVIHKNVRLVRHQHSDETRSLEQRRTPLRSP